MEKANTNLLLPQRNYGDFLMIGGPGCNRNDSSHCPRSTDDEYRTVRRLRGGWGH